MCSPPEHRLSDRRQLARHESQLHERPGTGVEDEVEHLVHIAERVYRRSKACAGAEPPAVGLPVYEHVVVKDAVEADVADSEDVDNLGELLLPVRAQRFVRPSSADTLVSDVPEYALLP